LTVGDGIGTHSAIAITIPNGQFPEIPAAELAVRDAARRAVVGSLLG